MIGEHSILDLLLGASLVVQFVMLLLIAASVASWAIILGKRRVLNDARAAADRFESDFWSGKDLSGLYKSLEGSSPTGMADIFVSGRIIVQFMPARLSVITFGASTPSSDARSG